MGSLRIGERLDGEKMKVRWGGQVKKHSHDAPKHIAGIYVSLPSDPKPGNSVAVQSK